MRQSYGRVVLSAIPTAILATILVKYAYPHNVIIIIAEGLTCMLVFAVLAWWFILNSEERKQILVICKYKSYPAKTITGNSKEA